MAKAATMATYSATTVALESPVEAATTTNSYQINDSGGYRINSPYNSCNSMVLLSVKKRVGHWLFGLRRELGSRVVCDSWSRLKVDDISVSFSLL